jgi:hypothetical protein
VKRNRDLLPKPLDTVLSQILGQTLPMKRGTYQRGEKSAEMSRAFVGPSAAVSAFFCGSQRLSLGFAKGNAECAACLRFLA